MSIDDLNGAEHSLLGFLFRFKAVKRDVDIYVDGFSSEADALAFVPQLQWALQWPAVVSGVASRAESEAMVAAYYDDPIDAAKKVSANVGLETARIDGYADGSLPCVFRTGARIFYAKANDPTVVLGCRADQFASLLGAGFLKVSQKASCDQKLVTALELFIAFHHESSMRARFVALVMSLEVLAPEGRKSVRCQELLARWERELDEVNTELLNETDQADFVALRRELDFRSGLSIRSRVRRLVTGPLGVLLSDHEARRAIEIYDMRGAFVHSGRADRDVLARAVNDGQRIVAKLLQHRLEHPDSEA